MNIEIDREKRKTMVLKVLNSDKALLKVPLSMSEKKVNNFLESKRKWLEKVSLKMKEKEDFLNTFDFSNHIYLHGENIGNIGDFVLHTDEMNNKQKNEAIKRYYYSNFSYLQTMAQEISQKTNLKYNEIRLLNSVRVWGSYSANGCMKLNWKLLILPKNLVYYVICHELCHSKFMNHKPKFWKEVERICPNSKSLRKELEKYSFVLSTKFNCE